MARTTIKTISLPTNLVFEIEKYGIENDLKFSSACSLLLKGALSMPIKATEEEKNLKKVELDILTSKTQLRELEKQKSELEEAEEKAKPRELTDQEILKKYGMKARR